MTNEFLLQLVLKQENDRFSVSNFNGGYIAWAESPIDAFSKWGYAARTFIRKYQNQEIELAELASRLGVEEEAAKVIAASQEIIQISDQRNQLDQLWEQK